MAFIVPDIEPNPTTGLVAGDWIQAQSMNSLVKRDRFVFATRRRMIASIGKVVTTASASYQPACALAVITLPTATDTLLIGVTASDDCTVRVSILAVTSTTVTTGGPGCIIGSLTGVPISTWTTLAVEVKSNTGSPVTIYGINIQEQILTAADLP
jgi:hypothetical protein